MVESQMRDQPQARLTGVLKLLGLSASAWYHQPVVAERRRPGPMAKAIPDEVEQAVLKMATQNPWHGYQRIAVMCRYDGCAVSNRQCYAVFRKHDLFRKPVTRKAEVYQTAKLWELLPSGPNGLWQMDVTYINIPGHGWRYAITVIDYYSRYLLGLHLTTSYSAMEATRALALARQEAERLHGPLARQPFLVTDNGSSFIARRFMEFVRDGFSHVRIRYRTPTQLGLLERFHRTLKDEEVYWRLYDSPAHARACLAEFRERYNTRRPHWALIPEGGGDPLRPADVYIGGVVTQLPRWQTWAVEAKKKLDEMTRTQAA